MESTDTPTPAASHDDTQREERPERFTLRVSISGICLHVFDENQPRLVVVMPDARYKGKDEPLKHPDREPAEPHAGYLRFDLRNLAPESLGMRLDRADAMAYEVVHLFKRERVELLDVPKEADPVAWDPPEVPLQVPALERFAPVLVPDDRIFQARPPKRVLMRMDLYGGKVKVERTDEVEWMLEGDLNVPTYAPYQDEFGGEVQWERTIPGDGMRLRLTNFDDGQETIIPLRATKGSEGWMISIQVANLCRVNPLEWGDLALRVPAVEDVDFKWLYRLLGARDGADVTRYLGAPLPYPKAVIPSTGKHGDLTDCTPMRTSHPVPKGM